MIRKTKEETSRIHAIINFVSSNPNGVPASPSAQKWRIFKSSGDAVLTAPEDESLGLFSLSLSSDILDSAAARDRFSSGSIDGKFDEERSSSYAADEYSRKSTASERISVSSEVRRRSSIANVLSATFTSNPIPSPTYIELGFENKELLDQWYCALTALLN